jgi:hypothetical protein
VGWFVKKLKSEKADLKELPLSGYSSRGGRPDPAQLVERGPMQHQMVASLLRTCKHAKATHPHPRTCISSPKRAGGRRRCGDWIPHKSTRLLLLGMLFNFLPRNPPATVPRLTTRRVGLRHDAMRTDDLHCGSCSASTQFFIHTLSPLWPKAPHGPNSKAT